MADNYVALEHHFTVLADTEGKVKLFDRDLAIPSTIVAGAKVIQGQADVAAAANLIISFGGVGGITTASFMYLESNVTASGFRVNAVATTLPLYAPIANQPATCLWQGAFTALTVYAPAGVGCRFNWCLVGV